VQKTKRVTHHLIKLRERSVSTWARSSVGAALHFFVARVAHAGANQVRQITADIWRGHSIFRKCGRKYGSSLFQCARAVNLVASEGVVCLAWSHAEDLTAEDRDR
jgi:hypothetical protein